MVKCSWSDSQSSSGDVHAFMSSFRRQTLKSPCAHFSLCVVNETRDVVSRSVRFWNRYRGCQTLINLRRAASSRTHLVLQAYCLTDVDEINPLGIEIWYRTTRRFSILGGIKAIRSVPKQYRTRYPALLLTIPHRFSMGLRSGEFAGQSSTVTPWSLNQLLVPLAVWAGAKSCWKMKSASP